MYDEATVTPPDPDALLAAAPGAAPGGNSSAAPGGGSSSPPYLGCVLVDMPAVMGGRALAGLVQGAAALGSAPRQRLPAIAIASWPAWRTPRLTAPAPLPCRRRDQSHH